MVPYYTYTIKEPELIMKAPQVSGRENGSRAEATMILEYTGTCDNVTGSASSSLPSLYLAPEVLLQPIDPETSAPQSLKPKTTYAL